VFIETFLRKQLGLKAHTVTKVEESERFMVVHIDRLGSRLLRCGLCRQRCGKVHSMQKPRVWRDLSMRKLPLKLRYRPRRVECPRCGVRVEDFPWAEPWARVTTALSNAVARLARELSWQGTARQYGLNWKSVATIVKRAVQYGLKHRTRLPVHVIGMDEVSRRKGQVYLTVVYDLERRVLLWVGDDRTEEAVRPFFTKEMGTRRCHTLRVICMDMWAAYANLVKEHAPQAQILFDRFHIVKHLNEAVEEVRRSEMRRLSQKEKVPFKRSRWLLLKNPWNLSDDQKERLSTLVRWNTPIVRAYYLLESTEIRGWVTHAARLVPSVRDRSSRSRMNFTRIGVLAAVARNSGRIWRRAMATTCSEGASPGRMVRIQEPKDRQTSVGCVAERI
jgi:transposase